MKWRITFHLDAADDETGIQVKDVTVDPVDGSE